MNPVLMLCRNALELTKRAVESVLAQDIPVQLLCVDNDSSDGTSSYLHEQGIQTYTVQPQIGVSRGWNYGLGYFFDTGNEHVLVINNDVVLRPDTYRELLEDGGPFVTGVGVSEPCMIEGVGFKKTIRPHPDFSCFLIRREVWDEIGPFDASMVHYASDADMHLRMQRACIPAYTIGLPFLHFASGTIKNAPPEEAQELCHQADLDRAAFEAKWGYKIDSEAYNEEFK